MNNKIILNNFIKLGIRTWLKSISEKIEIQKLNLSINNKFIGRIDKGYLEVIDLVYQNLYINKIIVKINNCDLKFKYKNHLIYSDNLIINSNLYIDSINLENIFYSKKCKSLRNNLQKTLTEDNKILNIIIKNNLFILSYEENKLYKEIILSLRLEDNLNFLENINTKKKMFLSFDKNMKFNSCKIKNNIINIDFSSKIIFDN